MSVEWTELSDYLAGELDAETEEALEQELFQSPEASRVVAAFVATIDGVATLQREHGCLNGILRAEDLPAMRRRHVTLEVVVPAGETASFPLGDEVAFCIARLPVDPEALEGAERVDLEYANGRGEVYARARDIHVERGASATEVIVACERHIALMEEITVFRVVGVFRGKEMLIGAHGVKNVPPVA